DRVVIVAVVEADKRADRCVARLHLTAEVRDQISFQRVTDTVEIRADAKVRLFLDAEQSDVVLQLASRNGGLAVDADANVIAGESDVGGRARKSGESVGKDRAENVPFIRVTDAVAVCADDHVVGRAVLDGLEAATVEERDG